MTKGGLPVLAVLLLTACATVTPAATSLPASQAVVTLVAPGATETRRVATVVPAQALATTTTSSFTDPLTPTAVPTPQPTEKPELNATEQHMASNELIAAAASGNAARVRELIAAGAPLNGQDERGRTAVMAATHGNLVEIVQLLFEAGADVNLRDNRTDNPFLYAGAEGQLEILKLAYAAGADPKITNRFGGTALIPACERGHVEVVEYLLTETTVDVNHVNNLGWTCLLEAIILSNGGTRHQEIVALALEHGADVNLADKDGVTPLAHAQGRGFREIQALLEQAGAR